MSTPVLDSRTAPQFFDDAVELARAYCPDWAQYWPQSLDATDTADIAQDPGLVLFQLFSLLAQYVADVENALPAQRQLAFYRFIDMTLRTAAPALAPLHFTLADGQPPCLVPAREAVLDEATQTIRFQTDADLLVVPAQLCAAFTMEPALDRYVDALPLWQAREAAPLFLANERDPRERSLAHCLLFGDAVLFKPDPAVQRVTIQLTGTQLHPDYFAQWFDGAFNPLAAKVTAKPNLQHCEIKLSQMPQAGNASIVALHQALCERAGRAIDSADVQVDADSAQPLFWLLGQPLSQSRVVAALTDDLPVITGLACVFSGNFIAPQQALANGVLVDVSNGAYPFGATPALDTAFYVRCDSVFSKRGAEVTLNFTLRDVAAPNDVTLSWQFWNGNEWQAFGAQTDKFTDDTQSLQCNVRVGETCITFLCPAIAEQTIAGGKGRWIRAVIAAGSYGTAGGTRSQFDPPYIRALHIKYSYTANPSAYWRHNAFDLERLQSAPYRPLPKEPSALYLGFVPDPFAQQSAGNPLTLYFDVCDESELTDAPQRWQWFDGSAWQPLAADDTSAGLARSGIVTFRIPLEMTPANLFSQRACWIRVLDASPARTIRVNGIYPNTVSARNLTTFEEEVLGSGNAQPDQTFLLSHTGVQPELVLQVVEPASFDGSVGPESPDNDVAHVWQRVDSFASTGPTDRVYTLDGQSGRITFGDGRNGMIPPNGTNNVIAQRYDTTQGKLGNVPAGALTLLHSGTAGIAGVTNPVAARGGVDGDGADDLKLSGPALTRANGCAVTLGDLETLAVAASPRVRRTCAAESATDTAIENASEANHGQRVEIAVLMVSDEPRPYPPPALLNDVSQYVRARCLVPLAARIDVRAPAFVPIDVDVALQTVQSRDQWNALAQVVADRLATFLHPVSGGPLGTGWTFGAPVRRAAVVNFLIGTSDLGIARVRSLKLNGDPSNDVRLGTDSDAMQTKIALPCAGKINVQFEAG